MGTPSRAPNVELRPEDIEVVAPNFKRRLSGVTATIQRLVPLQARSIGIVALGPGLGQRVPRISFLTLLRLATKPKRRPFRVWHARRNTEMLAGIVLRDVFRFPLRIVFTSASQRRHTRYTRSLIARVDAVISTSTATAGYLERPSTVVMHGIDTDLFRPAADASETWEATGLPGKIGIGCFGRIRHQKGTDVFVDAMIRVLPRFPEATAIIFGRATEKHIGFEHELKQKVRTAGLQDRILFLGEVNVDEIAVWYRRLGLFIAPQRWEGFGLTPLEAMASGVPVIATTVGAFPELVIDDETGKLVPPGNVEAMAAAAEALLGDPDYRAELGRAARRHIEANFTLEREAISVTAVYEALWRQS